jgi:hypothetical protein
MFVAYLSALLRQWKTLLTGSLVAVAAGWIPALRGQPFSPVVTLIAAMACLPAAGYRVWRDERLKVLQFEARPSREAVDQLARVRSRGDEVLAAISTRDHDGWTAVLNSWVQDASTLLRAHFSEADEAHFRSPGEVGQEKHRRNVEQNNAYNQTIQRMRVLNEIIERSRT